MNGRVFRVEKELPKFGETMKVEGEGQGEKLKPWLPTLLVNKTRK